MNLKLVTGPAFRTNCRKCGKGVEAGDNHTVYADLDGEAFKAYYCADCVNAKQCNRCKRPMKGTTPSDGACECGGLIESAFYVPPLNRQIIVR